MVTEQDEVKVLDFVLAKMPDKALTESGTLMGTAAYTSPEYVR
jgi:serine/threonine protein kinase